MRLKMKTYLEFALFAISFIIVFLACDKTPKIEPGKFSVAAEKGHPSPGEKITIYYRIEKPGDGRIKVSVNRNFGEFLSTHPKTTIEDDILKADYVLPEDAVGLFVNVEGFGTCFSGDMPTDMFMLFDENGKPVRGTRAWFVNGTRPCDSTEADSLENLFKNELEDNPDHLMAYSSRWQRMIWSGSIDEVVSDMAEIARKSEQYSECYAALAAGYAYLGEMDSAIAMLGRYMEKADNPDWAASIMTTIYYAAYDNITEEINALFKEIAVKYPESGLGKTYIERAIYDDSNKGKPDETAEVILAERIKNIPEAYELLARYRMDNLLDTALAAEAALKYIEYCDEGEIDRFATFAGEIHANMHKIVSLDCVNRGSTSEALEHAEKAYKVNDDTGARGEYAALAADCALNANNSVKAREYALYAVAHGSISEVEPVLSTLAPDGDEKSYLKRLFVEAASKCDTARRIIVVSDNGDSTIIGHGEIVVLDFWGPGCKPCVEEIPLLSELAGRYKEKPIRWLAITNYPKEYFTKRPFPFDNWEFCSGQKEPFQAFLKMSVIPQFFIVDSDARIRYSRIGSFGDDNIETPAKVLDMLLAEEELSRLDE